MGKIQLTIEDLFDIPAAEIFNPDLFTPVTSVSTDTRKITAGSLFVALKGKKFDGHNFIKEAVNMGASAVLLNRKRLKDFSSIKIPLITVKDTTAGLGNIAAAWRRKLNAKVISLTGSAGKTTTKEILSVILSEQYKVNKTSGNNNNHIGVPLTILSTGEEHDILLLEHGTNHFGEIAYTAGIAQPDYAFITNIGSSHLEFLKNRRGVFKEKIFLLNETAKNNGVVFINNDDELLRNAGKKYENKITYGFSGFPDIKGEIKEFTPEGNPVVSVIMKNEMFTASVPLAGEQNAKNFLAAAAVASRFGLNPHQIAEGLKKLPPVDKRINFKRFRNFILIDDTYNANPESIRSSLELMKLITAFRKKIAVLGDMFELGEEEVKLHRKLAAVVKKNNIDELYTIGKRMKYLHEALSNSGIIKKHFGNRESLKKYLREIDFKDSAVLVKGSRGMKMEEFVEEISKAVQGKDGGTA